MNAAEMARGQREQLDRYLAWVKDEGGVEGPTHLSTWFKTQQQIRLRWLKAHCSGEIMELGSNYGYVLAYCGGSIGVDWNENTVRLAKILNPTKEFVRADIRDLPFPDGYTDTVLLTDVLEHLPFEEIGRAINEARRVAREKVLVTVPNGECDTDEAVSIKHQWLADNTRLDTLVSLLESDGWWIRDVSTTEHFAMYEVIRK